jgi:hypothetical protein
MFWFSDSTLTNNHPIKCELIKEVTEFNHVDNQGMPTNKGMTTKAHDVGTPEARLGGSPWQQVDKDLYCNLYDVNLSVSNPTGSSRPGHL